MGQTFLDGYQEIERDTTAYGGEHSSRRPVWRSLLDFATGGRRVVVSPDAIDSQPPTDVAAAAAAAERYGPPHCTIQCRPGLSDAHARRVARDNLLLLGGLGVRGRSAA